MNSKRLAVIVVAIVLAITLLTPGAASAGESFSYHDCLYYEGTWEGASTFAGTCTFTPGDWGHDLRASCGPDQNIVLGIYLDIVLNETCVSREKQDSVHVPAEPGRCRIISVDNPIYVGTTFAAEWRGRLNSLRLREPGASILFLNPVPGSVHWTSNNSRVGTFATLGVVDVGNYFASCFADEGMVGAEIKTIVRR